MDASMNFSFKADARKPKNRTAVRVAALAGLTFLVVPLSAAIAQDMSFDLEEAESGEVAAEAEAGGEVSAEAKAGAAGDVLSELASTPEEETTRSNQPAFYSRPRDSSFRLKRKRTPRLSKGFFYADYEHWGGSSV